MQPFPTDFDQLQPLAIIRYRPQPIANICNHLHPVATICNQLQPLATHFATGRNHLQTLKTLIYPYANQTRIWQQRGRALNVLGSPRPSLPSSGAQLSCAYATGLATRKPPRADGQTPGLSSVRGMRDKGNTSPLTLQKRCPDARA